MMMIAGPFADFSFYLRKHPVPRLVGHAKTRLLSFNFYWTIGGLKLLYIYL